MDKSALDFEFNFAETNRTNLLDEAQKTLEAIASDSVLGNRAPDGADLKPDPAVEAASRLLNQLNEETAEFSAYPDVLELKESHFVKHGLAVPVRFKDKSKTSRFFWLRFPITLAPLEDRPFHKLECAVEFNPGVTDGHLRPRAEMILPDRKFNTLLEAHQSLELRIGENFEFEAAVPPIDAGLARADASVDAKAAAQLGLVAGPFKYSVKKATLEHSSPGAAKVFWRMSEERFFQQDDPLFVVVMEVPKEVKEVKIAAAMQAYHSFNFWAANLSAVAEYIGERVATFFRKGAPLRDTKIWDITPRLSE